MTARPAGALRRYILITVYAAAVLAPIAACSWNESRRVADGSPAPPAVTRVEPQVTPVAASDAARAPDALQLLMEAHRRCVREVRDYTCVFLRQERADGELGGEQAIRVLYRDQPQSVYMTWVRNPDRVKRALYVKGQRVGDDGQEQALIEPSGAIARLFVSELAVPIHGEAARRSGRHTIDQFGFRNVLERMVGDNARYAVLGGVRWTYEGVGSIDGRATHVLVRHLPYSPDGPFPDARMVVHLDQQWLTPTAIYSYADEQQTRLLASYVSTDVQMNAGLADADFSF